MPTSAATSSSVIRSYEVQDGDQRGVSGSWRNSASSAARAALRAAGSVCFGDLDEHVGRRPRDAGACVAQPVQADVRRDPEQQRRRRLIGELVGVAEDLDKDVVHGITCGVIVTEELAAAPEHHRAVGRVVTVRIDRHGQ